MPGPTAQGGALPNSSHMGDSDLSFKPHTWSAAKGYPGNAPGNTPLSAWSGSRWRTPHPPSAITEIQPCFMLPWVPPDHAAGTGTSQKAGAQASPG